MVKTADELEEEERRRRDEAFTRPSTRVEIRGKVPADHDEDGRRTRGEGAKATRRGAYETDHDEEEGSRTRGEGGKATRRSVYETDHDEDDGRTRGEGAKATRRSVHETDHDEDGRRKLEEEERRRRDEAFTRPSTRVEIRGKVPAERGHGHLDARAMRRS